MKRVIEGFSNRDLEAAVAEVRAKGITLALSAASTPRLTLRIGPRGASWYSTVWFAGKDRQRQIGHWPQMDIADARVAHERARDRAAAGLDPETALAEARKASGGVTLADLTDAWARQQGLGDDDPRPGRIRRLCASLLDSPARLLALPDFMAPFEEVRADRPSAARNGMEAVRTMFRWAVQQKFVTSDPTAGIRLPPKAKDEQRLPLPDIVAVLDAYDREPRPAWERLLFVLFALTGMRSGQALATRLAWINLPQRRIEYPASAVKGGIRSGKGHHVALSTWAVAELKAALQDRDRVAGGLLFDRGDGRLPDAAALMRMADFVNANRSWPVARGDAAWCRFHGLRRSLQTDGPTLGLDFHVIDMSLGHATASTSVQQHYAVGDRWSERLTHAEAWSTVLLTVRKQPSLLSDHAALRQLVKPLL